jgi:hypothetical protein
LLLTSPNLNRREGLELEISGILRKPGIQFGRGMYSGKEGLTDGGTDKGRRNGQTREERKMDGWMKDKNFHFHFPFFSFLIFSLIFSLSCSLRLCKRGRV